MIILNLALPMDVWFHVDNYSSAHVYIRCKEGEDFKTLSNDVVQEMCQLTRENSIEGSK
jgi:predicted ribosome quality control (RQC) complex YloA/Tae2 family protein